MKTKESPQEIYLEMKRRQKEEKEGENKQVQHIAQNQTLSLRFASVVEWYLHIAS